MFCPECGNENEDKAVFCENCGVKLQDIQGEIELETPKKVRRVCIGTSKKVQYMVIFIAVVLVLLCFVVFKMQYSAEKVAKQYTEAVLANDWNQLYDTLYVEGDGEFQTKEAFVTAMAMNEEKEPQACNIGEVRKAKVGADIIYYVNYTTENNADVMEVQMRRKGLVWKVLPKKYTLKKYTFSVPKGSNVSVDKIELNESYKKESGELEQDVYEISPIFGNIHYIEVSGKGVEKVGKLITGSQEEIVQVTACYDNKIIEEITKQAAEDLWEILAGAAFNKKFSDIEVLDEMYGKYKENVIETYEDLREGYFKHETSYNIFQKYIISNLEANSRVNKEKSEDIVEVVIKGDYFYEYLYTFFVNNEEVKQYEGNCEHTLSYIKEGSEWILYSLELHM